MDIKNLTSLINLSENIKETPEGYLLCCDVWLTMVGELLYSKSEYPEPEFVANDDGMIKIIRTPDTLNTTETIGSFVGKPVTFNHPENFVNVDNWKEYAVGNIVNPRFNGQAIEADLLITDAACIELVKSKTIRQVSVGAEYVPYFLDDGVCLATEIRGNHVALVKEGRAGVACSIVDSKKGARMGSLKKQLLDLLASIGLMVKQADELEEAQETMADSAMTEKEKESMKDASKSKDGMDESDIDTDVVEDSKEKDCYGSKSMDSKYVSKDEFKASIDDIKSFIKDSLAPKAEVKDTAVVSVDDVTMAKAEVLSPGIRPQSNIKRIALDNAYKTPEGKEVIDSISGGVINDSNADVVFNATYSLLKDKRKAQLADSLSMQVKAQDAANYFDVNAINAACNNFWKDKGAK